MGLGKCGTLYNQMLIVCAGYGDCARRHAGHPRNAARNLLVHHHGPASFTHALRLQIVAHHTIKCLLYLLTVGTVHAGILGAHAVLFATSLCIIIVDLIEGSDVFTQWYTYLVS